MTAVRSGIAQTPEIHDSPVAQTLPHAPQFAAEVMSVQTCPHSRSPSWQNGASWQVPSDPQIWSDAHCESALHGTAPIGILQAETSTSAKIASRFMEIHL